MSLCYSRITALPAKFGENPTLSRNCEVILGLQVRSPGNKVFVKTLEEEFADRFIRLHRAVLVAKAALAGFEKTAGDDTEAYGWALLRGVPDKLPVSRRQWAPAKAALTS